MPVSAPSRVDLPAPLGPITPSRHRSPSRKLTSSSSTLPLGSVTVSPLASSEMSPPSTNSCSSSPTRRKVAGPMPMTSASVTVADEIRWPFRNVPLWLPRSVISYSPPGDLRSSAWRRDTPRSATTTSLPAERPIRSTLAGSGMTALGKRSPTVRCADQTAVADRSARLPRSGGSVIEQDRTGPASGWPRRTWQVSVISTRRTRWPTANVPLVLLASSSSHWPSVVVKIACRQDTNGSSTTMSAAGSRPIQ